MELHLILPNKTGLAILARAMEDKPVGAMEEALAMEDKWEQALVVSGYGGQMIVVRLVGAMAEAIAVRLVGALAARRKEAMAVRQEDKWEAIGMVGKWDLWDNLADK